MNGSSAKRTAGSASINTPCWPQRRSLAGSIFASLLCHRRWLGEFGRQVKGFVQQFPQTAVLRGDHPFAVAVAAQLPQLVAAVDAQLEQQFTAPMGGLLAVAMGVARPPSSLAPNYCDWQRGGPSNWRRARH